MWEQSHIERHYQLLNDLMLGRHRDPEGGLFLELLRYLHPSLAKTPWLAEFGWSNGRCDLLLTDGHDHVCAVEVKRDHAVTSSGDRRKNERDRSRRQRRKVERQARWAMDCARRMFPNAVVSAIALLRTGDGWSVLWVSSDT